MKNSDIKYDLSKDYSKLYKMLKSETTVIGFIAIIIKNKRCCRIMLLNTNHFRTFVCHNREK